MKSYVIRIYRDEKDGAGQLLGTVERPGAEVKQAFTSREELWNILTPDTEKAGWSDRKKCGRNDKNEPERW